MHSILLKQHKRQLLTELHLDHIFNSHPAAAPNFLNVAAMLWKLKQTTLGFPMNYKPQIQFWPPKSVDMFTLINQE